LIVDKAPAAVPVWSELALAFLATATGAAEQSFSATGDRTDPAGDSQETVATAGTPFLQDSALSILGSHEVSILGGENREIESFSQGLYPDSAGHRKYCLGISDLWSEYGSSQIIIALLGYSGCLKVKFFVLQLAG
jgi:hypothetical protein